MKEEKLNPNVIILTAAVRPNPTYKSRLSGIDERLSQYLTAISDWEKTARKASFDLVVVETSGSEDLLAPYATTHGFSPRVECAARGKGAVEAAALDNVLGSLDLPDGSSLIKVTGRLMLRNPADVVVPVRSGAVVRRTLDRSYCDARLFATTYGFWRHELAAMDSQIDDDQGVFLEHVMAHRLINAEFKGASVGRFAVRPDLAGSSGTGGHRYGTRLQRAMAPSKARFETFAARTLSRKQV